MYDFANKYNAFQNYFLKSYSHLLYVVLSRGKLIPKSLLAFANEQLNSCKMWEMCDLQEHLFTQQNLFRCQADTLITEWLWYYVHSWKK